MPTFLFNIIGPATSTSNSTSASSSNFSQNISTPLSTLSYEEFRKRKQLSRTKKIQSGKKAKADEEVKVQVGVLEADGGMLKKLKGRTLPLVVLSSCSAGNLLKAATETHAKQFNKHSNYMLLYADYSIVQKLPGSSEDFVLDGYKKDLGKAYSKIYFYLCDTIDFERVKDFNEDTESDNEILIPGRKERKETLRVENSINISDKQSCQAPETSCPTCFRLFPLHEIEAHANICADNWIDPIGDVSDEMLEELFKENDFLETYTDEGEAGDVSPDDRL